MPVNYRNYLPEFLDTSNTVQMLLSDQKRSADQRERLQELAQDIEDVHFTILTNLDHPHLSNDLVVSAMNEYADLAMELCGESLETADTKSLLTLLGILGENAIPNIILRKKP